MPKVTLKTKSARGKTYTCTKCHEPILPGTKYYVWSFRYGGDRFQHEGCGFPRRGQLTQSKLAALYDALDDFDVSACDEPSDIAEAMRSVAETAREIGQEYQDAVDAMNMSGAGTENEEKAESLESFADEVESEADEIEGEEWEWDKPEDAADDVQPTEESVDLNGDTRTEWLVTLRDRAQEAINNCDL